jgi:hypothetical protein
MSCRNALRVSGFVAFAAVWATRQFYKKRLEIEAEKLAAAAVAAAAEAAEAESSSEEDSDEEEEDGYPLFSDQEYEIKNEYSEDDGAFKMVCFILCLSIATTTVFAIFMFMFMFKYNNIQCIVLDLRFCVAIWNYKWAKAK